jgi:hypothetical protein
MGRINNKVNYRSFYRIARSVLYIMNVVEGGSHAESRRVNPQKPNATYRNDNAAFA